MGPARRRRRGHGVSLGDRLRELRHSRRLTLTDVARKAGCSVGYLSEIERDRVSPTIASLKRVAEALGVPLTYFFSELPAADPYLVRRRDRAVLTGPGLGARRELLKTRANPSSLEPLLVSFEPGAESGREPHSHAGDEFLMLLRGRLEVSVNSRVYRLGPGDSLTFPSSVPHRWRNPGRSRAVAVWVNTPPSW